MPDLANASALDLSTPKTIPNNGYIVVYAYNGAVQLASSILNIMANVVAYSVYAPNGIFTNAYFPVVKDEVITAVNTSASQYGIYFVPSKH